MSGWATVTVKAHSEEEAEELREAFAGIVERDGDTRIAVNDETEVHALDWGYGSNDSLDVLEEHADKWSEAVIMECNDTSDAGDGFLYKSDGTEESVEQVDSAYGDSPVRGHDAAKELATEEVSHVYMR